MKSFIKYFIIFLALLLTLKYSFTYLFEQGFYQAKLYLLATDNEIVLQDSDIPQDDKEKINKIIDYKNFFLNYFEQTDNGIYSKTSFLDQEAVTYLVIQSPLNEVKAIENCFPIFGCFPYLGFFNESSATEFALKKRNDSLSTLVKPVYAYSTLGYLSDPIVSSFFTLKELDLAELIFHEMFHTLFFIEDNVELNEALANYFSQELIKEYFSNELSVQKQLKDQQNAILSAEIIQQVEYLNTLYKEKSYTKQEKNEGILKEFLQNSFYPHMQKKCEELGLKKENCFVFKKEWNNASFVLFLTYQKEGKNISELHQKVGGNLKEFLAFLEKKYQAYQLTDKKQSFTNYLF